MNKSTSKKTVVDAEIKTEPKEEDDDSFQSPRTPSKIVADLNKFKYEKKPHIKIEFEKESPIKDEIKGLWEPANWRDFLVNLRNMRANGDAPVDSMGCHMSMDQKAPPEVYRYQCLISLMLSSQTKDQVTFAAMERLRAHGLNIDNVLKMSDEELGKLIYPVGFWKTKVKYIKKTTQTLKEQYNGDIPDSAEKLCKLTGVGPKMAHICMKVAWNKITGIGVDTHVHRISNRIGWVKKPTTTPEDTRKALQAWLPYELWSEVNHLMVGFGQTICLPIGPICNECLNNDICPSSGIGRKSPKKTPKKNIKQELDIKTEDTQIESPTITQKKKITPKKKGNETRNIAAELDVTNKSENNSKEVQNDLDNFDLKNENLPTGILAKSPVKRNTRSKNIKQETTSKNDNLKHADIKETIVKTNPNIQTKLDVRNEEGKGKKQQKSPLKRKSPRTKQSQSVERILTDENDIALKKKPRAVKK